MALDEVAIVFGILVAETILASVHVRAHEQAAACGKRTLMRAGRRPAQSFALPTDALRGNRFDPAERTEGASAVQPQSADCRQL
jgi:hypothetical protein